jgi:hypothetical protein
MHQSLDKTTSAMVYPKSVKCEEGYLKAYRSIAEARQGAYKVF